MSSRTPSRSSANHTSTVADGAYRETNLKVNRITFLTPSRFRTSFEALATFWSSVVSVLALLQSPVDHNIRIDSTYHTMLKELYYDFSYGPQGYANEVVIHHALILWQATDFSRSDKEADWVNLLSTQVWDFFDMRNIFSFSQDQLWGAFSEALKQVFPPRRKLIRPKPDFAFGLNNDPEMHQKVIQWEDLSVPSTNLLVHSELSLPFFIIESNSLAMAHDILCSLDLQHELYILAIAQVQRTVNLYTSFSKRQLDEDGRPFCAEVAVVLLACVSLHSPTGCLQLLKFVEFAKSYGLGHFKTAVENVINNNLSGRI